MHNNTNDYSNTGRERRTEFGVEVEDDYQESPFIQKWGGLSAAALGNLNFAPLRWAVPGLLPEGLAILAGKPKFGKSFLALQLAVAVATGGKALRSIECEAGDVLYLALEDGQRRLQDRLRKMVPFGEELPSRLFFATDAKRLRGGLEAQIGEWLKAHPEARLVIIDTLARVKPEAQGRGGQYDEDAAALSGIHDLMRHRAGIAVVVVHHTRKLESDDAFETISGTHGLTGIADSLMVLAAHGTGAKLSGQGRDVEGFEKALTRDEYSGGWRLEGDARVLASTGERQALLDVLTEADGELLTTSKIAKDAGMTESNASYLLKKLLDEGLVARPRYGKWVVANPSPKSTKSTKSDPNSEQSDPYIEDIEDFAGGYGDEVEDAE